MTHALTLFYDSKCPLCAVEIQHMMRRDTHRVIRFEDIHAEDFSVRFPWLPPERAMQLLHGQRADGEVILGLDVTVLAWSLVGKQHWVAWLRWPGIRILADWGYRLFARYREPITRRWRRIIRQSDPNLPDCDQCRTAPANGAQETLARVSQRCAGDD